MSSESHADPEPGTPEELSRYRFLAQATIVLGSAVGVGVAIPVVASLIPKPELLGANQGFAPLGKAEFAALQKAGAAPVKMFFKKHIVDAYVEEDADYYVWGVKLSPGDEQKMREERPELFGPAKGDIDYPVMNLGFVIFSPICPHLNCKFDWDAGLKTFLCPCHGSQFTRFGKHLNIGPAPRGLDPLPFREQSGVAEVEWIKYKANTPDVIRVSYT